MKQSKNTFNFERRASLMHGDRMGQQHFLWTEDLVSASGMHFHVWIPKLGAEFEKDYKELFKRSTKRQRDAVSFSWEYIPEGACPETVVDTMEQVPDGAIATSRLGTGFGARILVILKPQPKNRESECPA